eukprot:Partr_v1_DN24018_c0_g1_i1_m34825 putative HD superfamily hydrolase
MTIMTLQFPPAERAIIASTKAFVKEYFSKQNYDPSHDFWHVERVLGLACQLATAEKAKGKQVDMLIVVLAALLHDVGDFKYSTGQDSVADIIGFFLESHDCTPHVRDHVINIVENISFRKELEQRKASQLPLKKSVELEIVQDADRLDAIGAIGVARCFSFGAARGRPLYDPAQPPIDAKSMTKEQYDAQTRENKSITLNHFHEKLFTLKDYMNTDLGKQLAVERDAYMHLFVDQFMAEWPQSVDI